MHKFNPRCSNFTQGVTLIGPRRNLTLTDLDLLSRSQTKNLHFSPVWLAIAFSMYSFNPGCSNFTLGCTPIGPRNSLTLTDLDLLSRSQGKKYTFLSLACHRIYYAQIQPTILKFHPGMHTHRASEKFDISWPWPTFKVTGQKIVLFLSLAIYHIYYAQIQPMLLKLHPGMHTPRASDKFDIDWPWPTFKVTEQKFVLFLSLDLLCIYYAQIQRTMLKLHPGMHIHRASDKFDIGWHWPTFEVTGQKIVLFLTLACHCIYYAQIQPRLFILHPETHTHRALDEFDIYWPWPTFKVTGQ